MRFEVHQNTEWLANFHSIEVVVLGGGNRLEPDVQGNAGLVGSCSQSLLGEPLVGHHTTQSLAVVLRLAGVGELLGIFLVHDSTVVLLIVKHPGEGRRRPTAFCAAANL